MQPDPLVATVARGSDSNVDSSPSDIDTDRFEVIGSRGPYSRHQQVPDQHNTRLSSHLAAHAHRRPPCRHPDCSLPHGGEWSFHLSPCMFHRAPGRRHALRSHRFNQSHLFNRSLVFSRSHRLVLRSVCVCCLAARTIGNDL
ncbi:hypothetical protein K438DRAFT_524091 [Mycena galopus ATCC 62051]|nr:hypothetical protein K438DRAFT_524091 [Mycena galopus ATCC 62051]